MLVDSNRGIRKFIYNELAAMLQPCQRRIQLANTNNFLIQEGYIDG